MLACLLVSCGNNELISQAEEPQAVIGFDAFSDRPTRAAVQGMKRAAQEMTNETLKTTGFSVWGTLSNGTGLATVFNKQDVTYDYSTNKWTYSPLRFWTADNDYAFTAIAPKNHPSYTFTPNPVLASLLNTHNGTIVFDQTQGKGETDLVYAFSTVQDAHANQAPVSLTFKHLLSRVNFRFTNGFPSSSSVLTIENLQLRSAKKGTLVLDNYLNPPVNSFIWTLDPDGTVTTNHLFGNSSISGYFANSTANGSGTTTEAYILPTDGKLTISFVARLYTKEGSTYTELSPAAGWAHSIEINLSDLLISRLLPGYSYTFVAELNSENTANDELKPIEFSATVGSWLDYIEDPYVIENLVYVMPYTAEMSKSISESTSWQIPNLPDGVTITCVSSNNSIATVSNSGLVYGVNEGSCDITLSADGYLNTVIHLTVTGTITGGSHDGDDNDG